MNADAMVNHSLWHQRSQSNRMACPACAGDMIWFAVGGWCCPVHPDERPEWKTGDEQPCPMPELHHGV